MEGALYRQRNRCPGSGANLSAIDTWEDWAPAWAAAADVYETLARKELAAGHLVTAGQYLQRASLTVHFARVFEDPGNALHHRQVALYEEAAPLLRPPATRVDIETPVATVPGYLRFPPAVENPGLALLIPGLDSVKEQMGAWEPYFLDRGMATLSIEGPGQGECRYQLPYRDHDYQAAVLGVAEYMRGIQGADPNRVVVFGTSMGGYIALKTAGRMSEILGLRGIAEMAGSYSIEWSRPRLPFQKEGLLRLIGADESEAEEILRGCTLKGFLGQITVPVLVVHGGKDRMTPIEHAYQIAEELGDLATLHIEPEGNHNINDHYLTARTVIADWAADRIREANAT